MSSTTRRVAIVTGAAQGIGRAIAIRLAHDGLDIVVSDLSTKSESMEDVASEIRSLGAKAIVTAADVSVEEQVTHLVSHTVKELGGLDVMVANAGVALWRPFLQTTAKDYERLFRINVLGTMLCYRIAGQYMVEQGRGGRLIGASSMVGKKGAPFNSAYSAMKFAVRGLTQTAAGELGPFGITVNGYAPGAINTPMLDSVAQCASESYKVPSFFDMIAKQVPLGRRGESEDVADVVSFLASKDSRYLTGQTLSVDGGLYFD